MKHNLVIAAIPDSRDFAAQVAALLGIEQAPIEFRTFADGNVWCKYQESIRETYLYVIGSTDGTPPCGSAFKFEQLKQLISAGVLASAARVTAVMPYFEMRQDVKDEPRTDLTATRHAREIVNAGASRIITMDLHADQAQGWFYPIPVDHLYASWSFINWLKKNDLNISGCTSPDVGGNKRSQKYARFLKTNFVFTFKNRPKQNESQVVGIAGDPGQGTLLMVDDAIDTGGTAVNASAAWHNSGAANIDAFIPHAILSTDPRKGEALYRIEQSNIRKLYVTDSIRLKRSSPKVEVITVAPLFAEAIKAHYGGGSISHLFLENMK